MSEPKTKRNPKTRERKPVVTLTPEQMEAAKVAAETLAAEKKVKAEALAKFTVSLPKMSNRQLRNQLKRVRREIPGGLGDALASALLIVFDGTKATNPKARLTSYPL